MPRALLYLRQSDTDGAGERSLSLDSQAAVLYADASREGWTVVGELRDADLKGYDETRPGLRSLYAACREGSVDLVAFWKLDRLARSLRLQENVLHELSRLGVEVYSNQDPHLATPLFRQVLGAMNEELTRIIAANVRRATKERRRRGLWHGPPPFGYRKAASGALEEADEADLLRHLWRQRAAGLSFRDLLLLLHERGIPSPSGGAWSRQTLSYLFRNRAYLGEIVLGDEVIAGAHPALVSPDLWQRVQQPGTRARSPRPKPLTSWLEGLVEHGCGAPLYFIHGGGKRPPQFRCAHSTGYDDHTPVCPLRPQSIGLAQAEALAWAAVVDALGQRRSLRETVAEARRRYRAQAPGSEAARKEAQERQERLVARRQRVEGLYLSGARDRLWFDAEDARIAAEQREVEGFLARLPAEPDPDRIAAFLAALTDLRSWAEDAEDPEAKRTVLRALGVVILSPAGFKAGRADAGRARVRLREEFQHCVA